MQTSEDITEFAKAMCAFQGEVKQPKKDKDNPFYQSKYVPLSSIVATIEKYATKHGLAYSQYPVNGNNGIGIETIIMHTSGEFIKYDPFFLPLDKQTAQGSGSSQTYARRYALAAAFGIDCDPDDDANEASGIDGSQQQRKPQSHQQTRRNNVSDMRRAVTPKQIGLIHGLWRGAGGKKDQLDPWSQKKFGKPISQISTREASNLITKLQEKQNKQAQKKVDGKKKKSQGKQEDRDSLAMKELGDMPVPPDEAFPF